MGVRDAFKALQQSPAHAERESVSAGFKTLQIGRFQYSGVDCSSVRSAAASCEPQIFSTRSLARLTGANCRFRREKQLTPDRAHLKFTSESRRWSADYGSCSFQYPQLELSTSPNAFVGEFASNGYFPAMMSLSNISPTLARPPLQWRSSGDQNEFTDRCQ